MSKKGIFALIAGVVAGTATGVLFSPSSGKKFRDSLKKEIDSGGTGGKSIYKHFKALANNIKDSAEEEIKNNQLDKKAKKITQEVVKKATPIVKKTQKKLDQVKSKAEKTVKKSTKTAKAKVKKTASKVKKSI